MKNTKRKSIMLLPESWEILKNVQRETNLNASEIINEILMMYWSRWTNHRKKRLEPYKKEKAQPTRTEAPRLNENVQDPQQDSNTTSTEELNQMMKELFGDE